MAPTKLPKKVKPNLKLHVAIAKSGKYVYEIAHEVGIWPSDFSAIKTNRVPPSENMKKRIADVLGMTVEELFDDDESVAS